MLPTVDVFRCSLGVGFTALWTLFNVCLWLLRAILSTFSLVYLGCISLFSTPCSKCACGPSARYCRRFQLFIGSASRHALDRVQSVLVGPLVDAVDIFNCSLGVHLTAL